MKKMDWVLRRAERVLLRGGLREEEFDDLELKLFWRSNGIRIFFGFMIVTVALWAVISVRLVPFTVAESTALVGMGILVLLATTYLAFIYLAYIVSITSIKDARQIRRQSESRERVSTFQQLARTTEAQFEAAKKHFLEETKVSQRAEAWPFVTHVWRHLGHIADLAAVALKEEVGAPCTFTLHALRRPDSGRWAGSPVIVTAMQDALSRARAKPGWKANVRDYPLFRELLEKPFELHKGYVVQPAFFTAAAGASPSANVMAPCSESMAVHAILNPSVQKDGRPLIVGFICVESLKDLSGQNGVRPILENFAHQVYYTLKLITEVTVAADPIAIDHKYAAALPIGWQPVDGLGMRAADEELQGVLDRQLERLISDDTAPTGRTNSGALRRPADKRDDYSIPPAGGQVVSSPDDDFDDADGLEELSTAAVWHPDADDLTWYVLRRQDLSEQEIERVSRHVEACDRCKANVGHLTENEDRFRADLEEELQRT